MKLTEIANGIAHDGRMKAERYEWDKLGVRSKPKRIKIADLNVDSYQRGEASRMSTIMRAKHFDHAAAGAVVVGQRSDGSFWIVDGLQRVLAETLRGDVGTVDCMVFQSSGKANEARVFQLCNISRSGVKAVHKFMVAVESGDEPECTINKWIVEEGFRVGKEKGRNEIGFPAYVVQFWGLNAEAAKTALLFASRIGMGEMSAEVFKGTYMLLTHGVNVEVHEDRIMKLGGLAYVQHEINAVAITLGKSKNLNICACGILKAINHRKRYKVKMDGADLG